MCLILSTMDERKTKFVECSDVFIITPGGIGTMDEFFEAITLRQLGKINHEVIVFNIDNFYGEIITFIRRLKEEKLLKVDVGSIFTIASDI